jgi:hypothetical protein
MQRLRKALFHFDYRLALVFVFGLTSLWFIGRVVLPSAGQITPGLGVYIGGARLLASGTITPDIYDDDFYRSIVLEVSGNRGLDIWGGQPPTASIMLLPLFYLPMEQATITWTLLGTAMLFGGLFILVRTFSSYLDWTTLLIVFSLGMLFRPVIHNYHRDQAYILIFFLMSLATVGFHIRRDEMGGIALALSVLFKIVGWPILLLLAWMRRWRYVAWFVGTVIFLFIVMLPLLSFDVWEGFLKSVSMRLDSPLSCVAAYQATRSWLCHVLAPQVVWLEASSLDLPWAYTPLLLLIGIVSLLFSFRLARTSTIAAFVAMISWDLLFKPQGEQYHHVVMLIPVVWLIVQWREGRFMNWMGRIALIIALILYITRYPITHPQLQSGWVSLLAYPRLYGAWLVWLAVVSFQFKAPDVLLAGRFKFIHQTPVHD